MAYVSNPGGGSGGMVRIQKIVCAGLQTTIDFTSIPSTYTDLKIDFSGHDTQTLTDLSAFLKVNNDSTAANYSDTKYALGGGGGGGVSGGAVSATTNGSSAMWCPGVGSLANAMSTGEIFIPNYAQTSSVKPMHSTSYQYASAAEYIGIRGWAWLSTAAINRLTLTCGGTAFANGSIATLYGIG